MLCFRTICFSKRITLNRSAARGQDGQVFCCSRYSAILDYTERKPIQYLFQPTLGPISARRTIIIIIGPLLALIKVVKVEPKYSAEFVGAKTVFLFTVCDLWSKWKVKRRKFFPLLSLSPLNRSQQPTQILLLVRPQKTCELYASSTLHTQDVLLLRGRDKIPFSYVNAIQGELHELCSISYDRFLNLKRYSNRNIVNVNETKNELRLNNIQPQAKEKCQIYVIAW